MVGKHVQRVMCLKDGSIHCQCAPSEITPHVLQHVFGTESSMFVHKHE
jgi:ABC-type cobalamin/Fe3+-siderophores transport system ATPase subunit